MKTMFRIVATLAALVLTCVPAAARRAVGQTTTAPQATTQTAAQAPGQAAAKPAGRQPAGQDEAARAKAEAARKALAAQQTAAEQARKDLEQAQKHVEQAQKQAQQQAQYEVQRDVEKVQEALKQAERQLELYAKGTAALDTARYEKALQAFAEAAALKGAKADGALYWKAFSEYKVAAMQAALESLKEIQKDFPDSRWLEQARALEFEVRNASGKPMSPASTPDEELKLLALNGLLNTDAEQALPMLEKMLTGQQSPRLKKRALFVLSQSKSPRAKEILSQVARNAANPDLQLDALGYLQLLGGTEDRKLLSDLYASAGDRDVKLRLIDALVARDDAKTLVDMARKETDPALRKRIVERLSRMKSKEATDYMLELINK